MYAITHRSAFSSCIYDHENGYSSVRCHISPGGYYWGKERSQMADLVADSKRECDSYLA
jgi:hypothetical protein